MTAPCSKCGSEEKKLIRGMCNRPCYQHAYRRGEHIDHEKIILTREELVDEWEHFDRWESLSHRRNVMRFAEHLGRPFCSIERALTRAGVTAARPNVPA